MHVSSGNRGWLWKELVLMQKMLKSGVPWPSHTLGVTLATGRLRRRWCSETDLTSSRWDSVSAHWRHRQESCTHALSSSPRFCIMCACPQIMCAKYYKLRCMFKKLNLVKVGAFAWCSVKIHVFFGMQFERRQRDNKQTYMKTEAYKLYSRVFWIFLPNFIKIAPWNFELYRFKVKTFFETQCIFTTYRHV